MNGGEKDAAQAGRSVVYCIVPRPLAAKLLEPLRKHFAEDASIQVVVECRDGDRRVGADRRAGTDPQPEGRRRVRGLLGRRVADRRTPIIEAAPPPLPRRAQRHLEELRFVERLEPATQELEDIETARAAMRIQAGDLGAFSEIYVRFFDPVYAYMLVLLRESHEAEDAAQQVFTQALAALPAYAHRGLFRAWLFSIARNVGITYLRRRQHVDVMEPAAVGARLDAGAGEEELGVPALDWITDRELLLFVERLPIAQRQVLLLRFMLDLPYAEIGRILGRSTEDVRTLQSRGVRFLRDRLRALDRDTGRRRPIRMRRPLRHAHVLRSRRFALLP